MSSMKMNIAGKKIGKKKNLRKKILTKNLKMKQN